MLEMCDVLDVGCSGCGILEMCDVGDVGCWGFGLLGTIVSRKTFR